VEDVHRVHLEAESESAEGEEDGCQEEDVVEGVLDEERDLVEDLQQDLDQVLGRYLDLGHEGRLVQVERFSQQP